MTELRIFELYTTGNVAILTFSEQGYLGNHTFLGDASHTLERAIDRQRSEVLLVDLADVTSLPSGMLGVLVGLSNRGVEIRLFNITQDVWMTLSSTGLEAEFELREGNLDGLISAAKRYVAPVAAVAGYSSSQQGSSAIS